MKKIIGLLVVLSFTILSLVRVAPVYADAPSITNTTPGSYLLNGWYTYFQLNWHATCLDSSTHDYNFRSDVLNLPDGSHTYSFYQGNEYSQWYTIDNGPYIYANICPVNGVTSYSLIDTLTLKLDTQNPVLSVTSPTDGQHLTGTSVTITGTASDASSGIDFVDVNGYSAARSGNNWSTTLYFSAGYSGSYPIAVKTYDFTGHFVTQNLSITVSPPPGSSGSSSSGASKNKSSSSSGSSASSPSTSSLVGNQKFASSASTKNGTKTAAAKQKPSVDHSTAYLIAGGAVVAGLSLAEMQWHIFSVALRRFRLF